MFLAQLRENLQRVGPKFYATVSFFKVEILLRFVTPLLCILDNIGENQSTAVGAEFKPQHRVLKI